MSTLNLKRTIALGVATAIALGAATASFARTHNEGAPKGDYINTPDSRCYTDEGYGRRASCDAGAY